MKWSMVIAGIVVTAIVGYLFLTFVYAERKFKRTFKITPHADREEVRQRVRATLLALKHTGKERAFARARATAATFCFIEIF